MHFISTGFKRRPGSDDLAVAVTPLDSGFGSITMNDTGAIMSTNDFVSLIFGYTKTELASMNIAELMPKPYSRYHHGYLAKFRRTGQGAIVGNSRGRNVTVRISFFLFFILSGVLPTHLRSLFFPCACVRARSACGWNSCK